MKRKSIFELGEESARRKARPVHRRKCSVLLSLKGTLMIEAHAFYRMICYDPEGLKLETPEPVDDLTLGTMTRRAMEASRFIKPGDPDWETVINLHGREIEANWAEWKNEMKRKFGIKTLKALYRDAAHVRCDAQDGKIMIQTGINPCNAMWQIYVVPEIVLEETVSDAELGAALNAALAHSRSTTRGEASVSR